MIRNLKLFLALVLSVGFLSFAAASTASAFSLFGDACDGNQNATVCEDADRGGNPIFGSDSIITVIVNILSIIIGVSAVIVIIIAGIQYMLSTGDPTKVNNAKNAILYALVGLGIAVAAQVIVRFIISRL